MAIDWNVFWSHIFIHRVPSEPETLRISNWCFIVICLPTYALTGLSLQLAERVYKSASRGLLDDSSFTNATRWRYGVFLSAVIAIGSCLFVMIAFQTPLAAYRQRSVGHLKFSGIGYLILGIGLKVGTALQQAFIQPELPSCKNVQAIDHGLFNALAQKNIRSPRRVCENMIYTWWLQFAVTRLFVVLGLIALGSLVDMRLEITRGLAGRQRYLNRLAERLREEKASAGETRPKTSDDQVPVRLISQDKHGHDVKHGTHPGPGVAETSRLLINTPVGAHNHVYSSTERIEIALSAYGVLATVASYSTCADLKSLMLVSRGVRNAILGASPLRLLWQKSTCMQRHIRQIQESTRHDHDHQLSLDPDINLVSNAKSNKEELDQVLYSSHAYGECLACGKRVCKACSTVQRSCMDPGVLQHFWTSRPCCSACFEHHNCRWGPRYEPQIGTYHFRSTQPIALLPAPCECNISNMFELPGLLTICKGCATTPDAELAAVKTVVDEKGSKVSYWNRITSGYSPGVTPPGVREVVRVRGLYCFRCTDELGDGPKKRVWWVCENCQGECRHGLHHSGSNTHRSGFLLRMWGFS